MDAAAGRPGACAASRVFPASCLPSLPPSPPLHTPPFHHHHPRYLFKLAEAMRSMAVQDDELYQLEATVRARLKLLQANAAVVMGAVAASPGAAPRPPAAAAETGDEEEEEEGGEEAAGGGDA